MKAIDFSSKRGEAVNHNSLLVAARSRAVDAGDGPRCCGQGIFAYFLFRNLGEAGLTNEVSNKVGEKAVSSIFSTVRRRHHLVL